MTALPADHAARERARHDHATSLVLLAGAGTGKTTLLIDRIEALLLAGRATLTEIAAVTFTENAATSLKLRLRERLERARASARVALQRERAARALEDLERAPVSTIHALCAAILQERPLECGVTPGFRVADEAQTELLFAEAWEAWLSERLTTGDPTLQDALEQGIPLEALGSYGERTSLRGLARLLIEQRDLQPLAAPEEADPTAWRDELLEQATRVPALIAGVPDADALASRLAQLPAFAAEARGLQGRVLRDHLLVLPAIPKNYGFKPNWPSPQALDAARGVAAFTSEARARWARQGAAALHGRLVESLLGVLTDYERRKLGRGLLDFLDLLLKLRNALRDSAALRAHVRQRFRYLIIDEFQDTDPLQVDIALRLRAELSGGLTVVGDPKQSIYRFRRAELRLFERVADEARARDSQSVLHLDQNFRSRPGVLRFVNRVFSELIKASTEAGQPEYEPLRPLAGLDDGQAVLALRFHGELLSGDELLEAEARALVRLLSEVARGRYRVRDPRDGRERDSCAGDVLVLARRLTQMRIFEQAMERAGLRLNVEGGKSFFDRSEVHELLAVLRAVEDPSDRVSLVAALRSGFLGQTDRDMAAYVLAGGRLALGATIDTELPGGGALAPALQLLGELHAARTHLTPAALIERLFDETRVLAALTLTRRGEGQIANLEKAVALARQARELGVLTLRGFARLLSERIESAREEPDLPSTRPGDPDTVRVLSIHRAKGLEAPVVALFDTADDFRVRVDTVPLWDQGQIAIGFREGCQPPGWEQLKGPEEARGWAEARRLLYVACTRARDWLIVPQPPRDARLGGFWRDLIQRLPPDGDEDVSVVDAASLEDPEREFARSNLRALAQAQGGDAMAARWEQARGRLLAAAAERRPAPIAVTARAAREAPPSVHAASALGREFGGLLHRVLEWIPLDQPAQAKTLAARLAPAFGLDGVAVAQVAEAVERVLASPLFDRARQATSLQRELRLNFTDGDDLLEGSIDLAFEEHGEWVLVDYKTDTVAEADLLAQAAHHAPQLQLYGRGLAQATGQRIKERLVFFTTLGRVVPV